MTNKIFSLGAIATALVLCMHVATAAPPSSSTESYPSRSIRLITGSTGSTSDITARFMAHKLGERWGQQIVVDNRAGVGGIIGGEIVANSAPDGYTLYVSGISTQVSAQFLLKKMPFHPE